MSRIAVILLHIYHIHRGRSHCRTSQVASPIYSFFMFTFCLILLIILYKGQSYVPSIAANSISSKRRILEHTAAVNAAVNDTLRLSRKTYRRANVANLPAFFLCSGCGERRTVQSFSKLFPYHPYRPSKTCDKFRTAPNFKFTVLKHVFSSRGWLGTIVSFSAYLHVTSQAGKL